MTRSLRGEAAASASAAAAVVQLDEGEGGVTTEDVAASGSAPAASAAAIGGLVCLGSTVSSKVGSGFGPSLGCFAGGGYVPPCSRLRAVKASTWAAMVASPRSTASAWLG